MTARNAFNEGCYRDGSRLKSVGFVRPTWVNRSVLTLAMLLASTTSLAASCGDLAMAFEEATEKSIRSLIRSIQNDFLPFLPILVFLIFGLVCLRVIEAIQLSTIRKELARLSKTLDELFRRPTQNGQTEGDNAATSREDND